MSEPALAIEPEVTEVKTFDFSPDLQAKIVAMLSRDPIFYMRTEGLIKPDYFDNVGHGHIVALVQEYVDRYKQIPAKNVLKDLLKDAVKKKVIASEDVETALRAFCDTQKEDITDREYVVEKVSSWVRHQAVALAILKSVDDLEKGNFEAIEKQVKEALDVGATSEKPAYDFFDEAESRAQYRKDEVSGKIKRRGIPTGVKSIDRMLYHKGWGRSELSAILGGPKAGKTTALIEFGLRASFQGFNVLYVSCEVSASIIADRADSNLTNYVMSELKDHIDEVKDKVQKKAKESGKFLVAEYPSGTMKPSDLRRTMNKYKGKGVLFDMVIVDYADIMQAEINMRDPIENSKQIWLSLRALAQEEDIAVLTATQGNREGIKSTVMKMEHVADDINKVRTVDLMISINKTEEEHDKGEARLFFAASRNQAGGFSVRITQNLEKARFITSILGIA